MMAYSPSRYTGDGSTTSFAITFSQYSWTSIAVSVENVVQTTGYAVDTTTNSVVFDTAPKLNDAVVIRRVTNSDPLYVFGDGAAFTGSNVDSNFEQYQTAFEEVSLSADQTYVESALATERAERIAADANLQDQISGVVPPAGSALSIVSWHGQTIESSIDIPDNVNAFSVGPQIAIAPGQTVTIGEGSHWNILGNAFEVDELYNVTANNLTTSDGLSTVSVANVAKVASTGIVPITAGGTGAATAAAARAALGLGSIATQVASAVAITGGTIAGITDLAVADGGTGASTAAAARANLGAAAAAGVTDASDAATGSLGEYLTASGSAVALSTSGTVYNICSLTLTPGDWNVFGCASLNLSAGGTVAQGGITLTSAATDNVLYACGGALTIPTGTVRLPPVTRRISVSANTVVYLTGQVNFSSGTGTGSGILSARRVR